MSDDTLLPPPPVPSVPGRNWWRVFGIGVILLTFAGGAIALGYVLGDNSGTGTAPASSIPTQPSTSVQVPLGSEPANTLDARTAAALAEIAEAAKRMDEIIVDFRAAWEPAATLYRREYDQAVETFQGSTTCEQRSNAYNSVVTARETLDAYRLTVVTDLAAEEERILLYRYDPNPIELQDAAIAELRKQSAYDSEVLLATEQFVAERRTIDEFESNLTSNC